MDPVQSGRHQRHQGRTGSGGCFDPDGIESIVNDYGSTGVDRAGEDGQPAYMGQGQAGEPLVLVGVDPEAGACGQCRGAYGFVGEHYALWITGRATRGNNQGITGVDRDAIVEACRVSGSVDN
jgi:hypothetical protein